MKYFISILIALWAYTANAKSLEDKRRELEKEITKIMKGEWTEIAEEKVELGNFKSTKQFDEESSLFTMRLKATINFPITDAASVWFGNAALKKDWMDMCEDLKHIDRVMDINKPEKRFYSNIHQFIGEPVLFIKGRTFISQDYTTIDKQKLSIENIGSAVKNAKENFSTYLSDDLILGKLIVSKSYMEQNKSDPNKTDLDFLVLVDPQGIIPNWVVNLVSRNWPEKTFYGLIKQIQKNEHKKIDFFSKKTN
ncbi:MAG: hypothetical protein AB8G05_16340 [Oligoflexales bacterium]